MRVAFSMKHPSSNASTLAPTLDTVVHHLLHNLMISERGFPRDNGKTSKECIHSAFLPHIGVQDWNRTMNMRTRDVAERRFAGCILTTQFLELSPRFAFRIAPQLLGYIHVIGQTTDYPGRPRRKFSAFSLRDGCVLGCEVTALGEGANRERGRLSGTGLGPTGMDWCRTGDGPSSLGWSQKAKRCGV
jgi:hypothetical protein